MFPKILEIIIKGSDGSILLCDRKNTDILQRLDDEITNILNEELSINKTTSAQKDNYIKELQNTIITLSDKVVFLRHQVEDLSSALEKENPVALSKAISKAVHEAKKELPLPKLLVYDILGEETCILWKDIICIDYHRGKCLMINGENFQPFLKSK